MLVIQDAVLTSVQLIPLIIQSRVHLHLRRSVNHGQAYKIEGECNPAVACQATCTGDYVYDNNNACTTCGNRKVDIAFEQCDRSTGDSNCVADCSGCSTGYHVNTTTNQCEVDSCPSLLEPRYGSCTFPATGSVVEGRFVTRSTNTPNYTGNVTLTCRNGQFAARMKAVIKR